MLETLTVSLATFFATIGPLDVAALFAALTARLTPAERRSMARRACLLAAGLLLGFALLGEVILRTLGITLPALRTAGGILLMLIGIDMVFARSSGASSATPDEVKEAETRQDLAVFPLATPLIAGPGAIGAVILLMANTKGAVGEQLVVCGALLAMILVTFLAMLAATQLQKLLGVTGMHVIERVFGVILTALAVQFIFDGIAASGLLR
jgi:multiple antibiotic resistance protein